MSSERTRADRAGSALRGSRRRDRPCTPGAPATRRSRSLARARPRRGRARPRPRRDRGAPVRAPPSGDGNSMVGDFFRNVPSARTTWRREMNESSSSASTRLVTDDDLALFFLMHEVIGAHLAAFVRIDAPRRAAPRSRNGSASCSARSGSITRARRRSCIRCCSPATLVRRGARRARGGSRRARPAHRGGARGHDDRRGLRARRAPARAPHARAPRSQGGGDRRPDEAAPDVADMPRSSAAARRRRRSPTWRCSCRGSWPRRMRASGACSTRSSPGR